MCIGEYLKVVCYTCVGGTVVGEDKKRLKEGGVHVVVGTPGRVLDLITKGFLNASQLKIIVLDEADEMLGRGFVDQMKEIIQKLPPDIQVALFSATMPPEILEMTQKFMRTPVQILVKNEQLTLDGIKQFYVSIAKEEWKFDTLVELYKNVEIGQCMIFANKKERVIELANKLKALNFVVSETHGDMEMVIIFLIQADRERIMRELRTGSSRVLVSTDLLGRGIDIQQVNLIINYDLPTQKEKYIHRIGRAGRFGRRGVAINFVTPGDAPFLVELKQYYSTQIDELPMDLTDLYK
jgi:translation initiation factor 4A